MKPKSDKKYKPSNPEAAGKAITYYKNYGRLCGSINSALVFQQLEFCNSLVKAPPFYKFLSPLEKETNGYRRGDSWTEELGMSESEFRVAFGKIGIAYKSKKEFNEANNKFKAVKILKQTKNKKRVEIKIEFEAMYCSYHNKRTGQTFYYRNDELIKRKLKELQEEIKNENLYETTIATSVDEDFQATEIENINPEYTERITEKLSEKICLCYTTGEPVLDDASFMWNTTEGLIEYIENENKSSELTIYINRNLDEAGNVKNNKNTVPIKITPLKMEALIDYHIEKNFYRLNDSPETLLASLQQRQAVRKMLTSSRIGHNGIEFRTQELETMQGWAEEGFSHTEDILELGNTPVRMMYNHGSIRYTFKKYACSDIYYDWLKINYPEKHDAIFKEEKVIEQEEKIDTS